MITIDKIIVGNKMVVTAFGTATTGIVIDVDENKDEFTYITDDSSEQETINLRAARNNKVPGNVYDLHKVSGVIIANFRSWQSGKYYADNYND